MGDFVCKLMELADQSKKVEENDVQYDPIPWDRLRRH
jgi:hypothetical protein